MKPAAGFMYRYLVVLLALCIILNNQQLENRKQLIATDGN
ncbi:MAG: hypothetical protein HONDAALG_03010 [Gammaproteobacteria bacterium]|nr:hypothetical protein [Gammaproteobacteria bacterium]